MRARACAFPPQTARRTTSGLGRHLGRAPAPRRPPRPPRCVVPHVCVCALALSRGSKALANATELRGRRQGERPHLAASIILAAPLSPASGSPPRPLSVTPAGVVASHALAMARGLEAKSASRSSRAEVSKACRRGACREGQSAGVQRGAACCGRCWTHGTVARLTHSFLSNVKHGSHPPRSLLLSRALSSARATACEACGQRTGSASPAPQRGQPEERTGERAARLEQNRAAARPGRHCGIRRGRTL